MLAAAVSASSDPARKPETSSEEADDAVAAMVYGPVVHCSLDNVDRLLRLSGGSSSFVDNLLLRHRVSRLLVDRSGRLVADLRLVSLGVRVVVGHDFDVSVPLGVSRSDWRGSSAGTDP